MASEDQEFEHHLQNFPDFIYHLATESESFRRVLLEAIDALKANPSAQTLLWTQVDCLTKHNFNEAANGTIAACRDDNGLKGTIILARMNQLKEYQRGIAGQQQQQQQQQRQPSPEPLRAEPVPPPRVKSPPPLPSTDPTEPPLPPPHYAADALPPAFNTNSSPELERALNLLVVKGHARDLHIRLREASMNGEFGLDVGDAVALSEAGGCLSRDNLTKWVHLLSAWAGGNGFRAKALAPALCGFGIHSVYVKR